VSTTTETGAPVPDGLIARLRADPLRAPETIALAAAEQHGPTAEAWVAARRDEHDPAALARLARKRHAQMARVGGAATGLGGALTIVPDLAALAWIQSRMVFFIAAAYGFDPRDPMRPAELLVLQEVYRDPAEARQALDGQGRMIAQAYVDERLSRADPALAKRLASFVGRRAVNRLAGKAIPGVAVAVNAIGNERDTRALGDRCIRFYGG
jgi:hypothetical protein